MHVDVHRVPGKVAFGITGDGRVVDPTGAPTDCAECGLDVAAHVFEYYDPDNSPVINLDANPFQMPLCHDCYDGVGASGEHFYCEGCHTWQVLNYSWETFNHVTPDGEQLCLACAALDMAECFDQCTISAPLTIEDITEREGGLIGRVCGRSQAIPPMFEVVEEFDGVADWDNAPTSIGTVLRAANAHLETTPNKPVALAITHGWQFAVDIALLALPYPVTVDWGNLQAMHQTYKGV